MGREGPHPLPRLDGVYQCTEHEPVFHAGRAPRADELQALLVKLITRLVKLLRRRGLRIEEQGERTLASVQADPALTALQAASCTYRIAMGPRAGHKVLSLQSIAARGELATPTLCANAHGFSLHVGLRCRADFQIGIEHCLHCGGNLKIIAAIEDPALIVAILTHLGLPRRGRGPVFPPARAPPRSPARHMPLFQAA